MKKQPEKMTFQVAFSVSIWGRLPYGKQHKSPFLIDIVIIVKSPYIDLYN